MTRTAREWGITGLALLFAGLTVVGFELSSPWVVGPTISVVYLVTWYAFGYDWRGDRLGSEG
jgi:hypothetical protein